MAKRKAKRRMGMRPACYNCVPLASEVEKHGNSDEGELETNRTIEASFKKTNVVKPNDLKKIPRFASVADVVEPLDLLANAPSVSIPKEYSLRLLRYLEREPVQRLEDMGRYLLDHTEQVLRIDRAMFARYDDWYLVHQARSTNLAYALRTNWAQAGLIAGWDFEHTDEIHGWISPALASSQTLQGRQAKAFTTHLAQLCRRSPEAFELCAVTRLQMTDAPRWATQLDWRLHSPGFSSTFVALKVFDDMRDHDIDVRHDAQAQLKLLRAWWPVWTSEIEQSHGLYESIYGEDTSMAATRRRAEMIAARTEHVESIAIPEGHSL